MGDRTEDDPMDDDSADRSLDGSGLVRAFERASRRALAEAGGETARERTEWVLEAAAYVGALELVGRLSSIERAEREALAAKARRTLLALAGLATDEDDRDALELAARYAREGLRALAGSAGDSRGGDSRGADSRGAEHGALEPLPPVRDLVRLARGELDGFASADVALRLRASPRGRAELARIVPSMSSPAASRFRVAADSLSLDASATPPAIRDPRDGRAVGSLTVGAPPVIDGAFEAFVFPDAVLAIYADPPLVLHVTGAAVEVRSVSPGYVELGVQASASPLTLRVEYGDRVFDWVLSIG